MTLSSQKPKDDLIDFFFAILIVIVIFGALSYFYGWMFGWIFWLFVTDFFRIKLKTQITAHDFVFAARCFLFFFLMSIVAVVKIRQLRPEEESLK